MSEKPRILQNSRDMILTMVVLLVACLAIAWISGSVSFSGRKHDGVPAFQVHQALRADARTMSFPIRDPQVPEGWKPNSGRTGNIGDSLVSSVGYITKEGMFLQLSQTNAPESRLVSYIDGSTQVDAQPVNAAGRQWVAYRYENGNKAWTTNLDGVWIGLYGKASDKDFNTLATIVVNTPPISKESVGPIPS